MSLDLKIPIWYVCLILFTTIIIPFTLSGIGIYYFVSEKLNTTVLIISTIIFFSVVTLRLFINPTGTLNMNLKFLGLPFSGFAGFVIDEFSPFEADKFFHLLCLIGMVLNYFALFGVVNFIQRIFSKVNS